MSTAKALEKDWYLHMASKQSAANVKLTDIAECRIRDLDNEIARDKQERRERAASRKIRPVDLGERFTVAEVAKLLKVAESTVYDWTEDGTIEAERHGPTRRLKRISQRALEDYLRKR